MLLEAAHERNEPLPGFIYDSGDYHQRLADGPPENDGQAVSPVPAVANSPAGEETSERTSVPPADDDEEAPDDPFRVVDRHAFKLGLGDFIFYSLLVGRAAAYSTFSWIFCFFCVMMGMVMTLCSLLFLRGKIPALPALPISIFGGVFGFFLSKYVMVPFVYSVSFMDIGF
jgi:presenilin 1